MHEHLGSTDPNLLLGIDAPDDAAVYRLSSDLALVQTVDFFTPIVDDPYDWGAIAAANAMSDVYAMGGEPLLALNLVGWPREALSFDLLTRVLEGAADKASEAGVSIVGGHTVDDAEPKFGMSVTGTVHPDQIVRVSDAKPGALLFLTKPLGTGIISTAIKKGIAGEELIAAATKNMLMLNRDASRAMRLAGPLAATDVTGFGFLGHLQHMARASHVSAEVWFDEVPVMDGVRELAEKDVFPGGSRRNANYFSQWVEFEGLDEVSRMILFDAQTSGGLLIAIDPAREADLLRSFSAVVVGRVTEGDSGRIKVKQGR